MKLRLLVLSAALAVAGACAHGRTLSDKVSDDALARVSPDRLADVNQSRLDVAKAQDNLARENLRLNKAKNYVDVANNEVKIAKDEQSRDEAAEKASNYARDTTGAKQADAGQDLARRRLNVAQSHVQAATQLQTYAQARVTAAQKAVDLANARLEWRKYQAVQASGDQAAQNIDGQAIQKRVEDARAALESERSNVASTKAAAGAARDTWISLRDQLPASARFGVGGSGASGTAATGNKLPSANRDLSIDKGQGAITDNPNDYDDSDLFQGRP